MAACRQINHASAINTLTTLSTYCYKFASLVAGWSSLVARRAHNPKVTGSNPVPATKKNKSELKYLEAFIRNDESLFY